jgi:competence protein ComFC
MTTSGGTPTSFSAWRSLCRFAGRVVRVGAIPISVLYPPACVLCGQPLRSLGVLCEPCARSLPELSGPRCCRCGDVVTDPLIDLCIDCGTRVRAFERVAALGPYETSWKDLVNAFKFGGEQAVGRWLAVRMAEWAQRLGIDEAIDLVTYVPMAATRRRSRGFNQARCLAVGVAKRLNRPVARTLVKETTTPPQRRLSRTERQENLRGAFRLVRCGNERILLVDDVCTTGSTVEECARALKQGGYPSVSVLTVARA